MLNILNVLNMLNVLNILNTIDVTHHGPFNLFDRGRRRHDLSNTPTGSFLFFSTGGISAAALKLRFRCQYNCTE